MSGAAEPAARGAADAFARRVVRWQRASGRHDLPWQGSQDPYRVWLSEVMLQQTQVATVRRYYGPFVARFPDVAALAKASVDDVLAAWSGLGYYRRARLMHRCAQQLVAERAGVFPASSAELAQLPGIGPSTAAAIAAFCHGERAAIFDGNVQRLLARWSGFDGDLSRTAARRELELKARELLPANDMAAYTQGLMDLGATLCTPRAPGCASCPLAGDCSARRSGRQAVLPLKGARALRARRESAWLWLNHGGRHWLARRPDEGIWGGLWSLPEAPTVEHWLDLARDWPGRGQRMPTFKHALTHFDWLLSPLRWVLPDDLGATRLEQITADLGQGRWVGHGELGSLGMPAPVSSVLESES